MDIKQKHLNRTGVGTVNYYQTNMREAPESPDDAWQKVEYRGMNNTELLMLYTRWL